VPGTNSIFCELYNGKQLKSYETPDDPDEPEHVNAMTFRRGDGVKRKYISWGQIRDFLEF